MTDLYKNSGYSNIEEAFEWLKIEYKDLVKDLPNKLKHHKIVKNDLKEIKSVITEEKFDKIDFAFRSIEKNYNLKDEIYKFKKIQLIKKHDKTKKKKYRGLPGNLWLLIISYSFLAGVLIFLFYKWVLS